MSNLSLKFSALREKYPEDIEKIEIIEAGVKELLQVKEYSLNPTTKAFINSCRETIKIARKRLAFDKTLIGCEKEQRELWAIIEGREWFLSMVARDYDSELKRIESELAQELSS